MQDSEQVWLAGSPVDMSRGRGRGRGRGRNLGNLEVLVIQPGEPPPPPILQPPPLFAPLDKRPLELNSTPVDEYMLSLKLELRQFMKQSPFHLKTGPDKRDIHRYSDKYQEVKDSDLLDWKPGWNFLPQELRIQGQKRKRQLSDSKFKPVVPSKRPRKKRKRTQSASLDTETVVDEFLKKPDQPKKREKKVSFSSDTEPPHLTKKLDQLEKSEEAGNESGEGEEIIEDDEYYEEELEEETDYNVSYFDNGEEYGMDEEDALEEGPYY